jgi:protein PhnA
MSIEKDLDKRSNSSCELCKSSENLKSYEVLPQQNNGRIADFIMTCETCFSQIDEEGNKDTNHWRCLNDSMWSEVPAVQVVSWRMLQRLRNDGWSQDLLDKLYLDDDTLSWAKALGDGEEKEEVSFHKDSNGVRLEQGDSVVLIKDLNVKGGGFTAKRGTAVRNISLVFDNPEHIEGKVNDQQIVIFAKYVKK